MNRTCYSSITIHDTWMGFQHSTYTWITKLL